MSAFNYSEKLLLAGIIIGIGFLLVLKPVQVMLALSWVSVFIFIGMVIYSLGIMVALLPLLWLRFSPVTRELLEHTWFSVMLSFVPYVIVLLFEELLCLDEAHEEWRSIVIPYKKDAVRLGIVIFAISIFILWPKFL